jgi:thiazole tautomerase (transcriptional regulator TenI)
MADLQCSEAEEAGTVEIHVLSNGRMSMDELVRKACIIAPYVHYIHLREKSWSAMELVKAVNQLQEAGVPLTKLVLNDRADAATVSGAAGVQLAWHSLPVSAVKQAFPSLRVGRSVHSAEEARQACMDGADYVIYGHIYATSSKPNLPPRGLDALQSVVQSITSPVIALGGIQPGHIEEIEKTGAAGYAVMSGIMDAEDPYMAIQAYVKRRQS